MRGLRKIKVDGDEGVAAVAVSGRFVPTSERGEILRWGLNTNLGREQLERCNWTTCIQFDIGHGKVEHQFANIIWSLVLHLC